MTKHYITNITTLYLIQSYFIMHIHFKALPIDHYIKPNHGKMKYPINYHTFVLNLCTPIGAHKIFCNLSYIT